MSQALENLLDLLTLQTIDTHVYLGQSQDIGLPQIFGGQVIGQAIVAAGNTVPDERDLHSLHCNFIRPGDSKHPIYYHVQNLRDGKSFSVRYVTALQHEHILFTLTASFQKAEVGLNYQNTMPQVESAEDLVSQHIIAQKWAKYLPDGLREVLVQDPAVEMRPVKFYNPLKGEVGEANNSIWLKANGQLTNSLKINQALLGYLSDFNLLPTALQPHGFGFLEPHIQIATLDHSMWFHRPFNLNDWLLYYTETTNTYGCRGLVRGQIYNKQGELIATCMQEGVIRKLEGQ